MKTSEIFPKKEWNGPSFKDVNAAALEIFTDGACWPNPGGDGGWGFVVVRDGHMVAEFCGPDPKTTNNRAELKAIVRALLWLAPGSSATIVTDSQLAVKILSGTWRAKANLDLVKEARQLMQERHITFRWVRGHAGNQWNERADYRWVNNGAGTFADAPDWLVKIVLPRPPAPRPEPKPPPDNIENYVAAAAASELRELSAAQDGTRNDALNRAAFNLAQFVKAGGLPEDWTRGQLEAHAVGAGLSIVEARRTIDSAFRAAQPRSLPS